MEKEQTVRQLLRLLVDLAFIFLCVHIDVRHVFLCCYCLDDRCIGHVFSSVVDSDGAQLLVGYTCSKVCSTGRDTDWSALVMIHGVR